MKLKLLVFLFPLCQFVFSQDIFLMKGKIVSDSHNLEGIHVVNYSKHEGVTTERGGYFSVNVSVNDTLLFSAIHLKGYMHVVTEEDKIRENFFVPMESNTNLLDEVTLTKYKNITPEALGIIPKGMKSYTPAERRLATAGDFRWYSPLLIPVGGMSVDGLLNAISGRTAMLKKEVEVEKNERLIDDIKFHYNEEFMINKLHIEEDYVDGFVYFLLDEQEFLIPFKEKNKTMCEFVLSKLATKFLELQKANTNEK